MARLLGVADLAPPALTGVERTYVAGFLAGLQSAPPPAGAVPVLPARGPLDPEHAGWINGALAGAYSRTETGGPPRSVLVHDAPTAVEEQAHPPARCSCCGPPRPATPRSSPPGPRTGWRPRAGSRWSSAWTRPGPTRSPTARRSS
ncbi:hypothetical protein ACFQ0M_02465 [Kitasatospora aburaviensis]